MVAEVVDLLTGTLPDRLRLEGREIAAAFSDSNPTYAAILATPGLAGTFLDECLEPRDPPVTAEQRAASIRRDGHWDCVPDDEGVSCTRV